MAKVPPSVLDLIRRKNKPSFRGKGLKRGYAESRAVKYTYPDRLADAKFAYSTYDLFGTGRAVIRLRDTVPHTGDDTERDFTAKELTDGTFTYWAQSQDNDGIKVVKVYDQAFRKRTSDFNLAIPNSPDTPHPAPVHLANTIADRQPAFKREDLTIKFDVWMLEQGYDFPHFTALYSYSELGSQEANDRVRGSLEVGGWSSSQTGYLIGNPKIAFMLSMKTATVGASNLVNITNPLYPPGAPPFPEGPSVINSDTMRTDWRDLLNPYASGHKTGWDYSEMHGAASVYYAPGPSPITEKEGIHFGNNYLPTPTSGGTNVLKLGMRADDNFTITHNYSTAQISSSLETYTFQHVLGPIYAGYSTLQGYKGNTKVMEATSDAGFGTAYGMRLRSIRLGENHFRTSAFLIFGGYGENSSSPNSHIKDFGTGFTQEDVTEIDAHLQKFYNY